MSIRIKYKGNIGNCLFQYVYARLLADRNAIYLHTPFPYQKFLRTTVHKIYKSYTLPYIIFDEPYFSQDSNSKIDVNGIKEKIFFYNQLNQKLNPGRYMLNGYFEYSELFNPYESIIKSYFQLNNIEKNMDDIVMNIRLGDFVDQGRLISYDWYLKILEKEKFGKLYIVGAEKDELYLKPFINYNPIIVPNNPISDFHFIRKFNKIICSNSTYCWWAAFLSEADKIYISDKWISPLLTSCKNSVMIKADYIKSYTTYFYYPVVRKDKYRKAGFNNFNHNNVI